MTAVKHVPSIGILPVATSVPARNCNGISPDERLRCFTAQHAPSVLHQGYDPVKDATVTW